MKCMKRRPAINRTNPNANANAKVSRVGRNFSQLSLAVSSVVSSSKLEGEPSSSSAFPLIVAPQFVEK